MEKLIEDDPFLKYYNEFINYAKVAIKERKLHLSPEDLVNDAFIKYNQSGEDFNFDKVKHFISTAAWIEKDYTNTRVSLYDDATLKPITGEKVCEKCKQPKSVNSYRYRVIKGVQWLVNICRDCEHNYVKQWLSTDGNRKKWNEYMRQWRLKKGITRTKKRQARPINELWNKANKRYQAKQREGLTDVYIRGLLKKEFKNNPEAIERKRIANNR